MLHIVVPGVNGMQSEYLKDKEQRVIKGEAFTFNNPLQGAINLSSSADVIMCNSPYEVETMSMDTRATDRFSAITDFTMNRRTLENTEQQSKKVKNTIEYKRNDNAQTETQFNRMFENTFEENILMKRFKLAFKAYV